MDHDPRNQLLQCFEFHDKHGRNRRKERICFDHELVRDQNKCVLYGDYHVMKFKALEQLFRVKIYPVRKALLYDYYSIRILSGPACGPFKGPGTRMSMDISVQGFLFCYDVR